MTTLTRDETAALTLEVDPASIPNHIDVDVTNLTIGHPLHVSDLQLPAGVKVLDDPEATVAFANKWNAAHRFMMAAVKDNGNFVLSYDIGMIGGTTRRNFADTLDWWSSMLGEAADFFAKELK